MKLTQSAAHARREHRAGLGQVREFRRIVRHSKQFGPRRVDVLEALGPQRPHRRVAEVNGTVERLRVRLVVGNDRTGAEILGAGHPRGSRSRHAREAQDGRHEVDAAELAAHSLARAQSRAFEDERHLDRGVVDEKMVLVLAVVSESLAVIRGHHHEARRRSGISRHKAAKLRVGGGDLTVIRCVGEPAGEGRRRLIRVVGLEKMDPDEARGF